MASAYSFDNYDTYTQICASTPQTHTATATAGMHNFITYNTNVSDRKYHDLEHFQLSDMLLDEADEDAAAAAAALQDSSAAAAALPHTQDEDDLFQIEDVDTCNYSARPALSSSRNVSGSLPSLMLDASSDEESEDDDNDDDNLSIVDCGIIASAAADDEDVSTWSTAVISPYLHPRNAASSAYLAKKQQLTFDSILPNTQHSANTLTSVAADNYNLWLSYSSSH